MKRFRGYLRAVGAVVAVFVCSSGAADLVIDDFTQGPLDLEAASGERDSSVQDGLNVLGGVRETRLGAGSGGSGSLTIATPPDDATGSLAFSSTPTSVGLVPSFGLQYDGNPDGNSSTANGQLGNVDLTEGGNDRLQLRFLSEPEVGSFSFLITNAATEQGYIEIDFDGRLIYEILYTDITNEFGGGPVDYSDVVAFSFGIIVNGSVDATQVVILRDIRAIPEPSSALLLSAFGLGLLLRRRRSRSSV